MSPYKSTICLSSYNGKDNRNNDSRDDRVPVREKNVHCIENSSGLILENGSPGNVYTQNIYMKYQSSNIHKIN